MAQLKIALVDDHRLFRTGIGLLLKSISSQNQLIFEAENGVEMIKKLDPNNLPDIIFMDINMPVMNGIESVKWLKDHYPGVKVIVLSMFDDAEKVLAMVKLNVKGYILKDTEPSEFELAIAKVSRGDLYYPDFVTRHLVSSINAQDELVELNSRELQFLKLVATELTYKEIADQMFISIRTVDAIRDTLFEKLSIKSRVGLVLYAVKEKMVTV